MKASRVLPQRPSSSRSRRFSQPGRKGRGPNPHFKRKSFLRKIKRDQKHDLVINKNAEGEAVAQGLACGRVEGTQAPSPAQGVGAPKCMEGEWDWSTFSFQASLSHSR